MTRTDAFKLRAYELLREKARPMSILELIQRVDRERASLVRYAVKRLVEEGRVEVHGPKYGRTYAFVVDSEPPTLRPRRRARPRVKRRRPRRATPLPPVLPAEEMHRLLGRAVASGGLRRRYIDGLTLYEVVE